MRSQCRIIGSFPPRRHPWHVPGCQAPVQTALQLHATLAQERSQPVGGLADGLAFCTQFPGRRWAAPEPRKPTGGAVDGAVSPVVGLPTVKTGQAVGSTPTARSTIVPLSRPAAQIDGRDRQPTTRRSRRRGPRRGQRLRFRPHGATGGATVESTRRIVLSCQQVRYWMRLNGIREGQGFDPPQLHLKNRCQEMTAVLFF